MFQPTDNVLIVDQFTEEKNRLVEFLGGLPGKSNGPIDTKTKTMRLGNNNISHGKIWRSFLIWKWERRDKTNDRRNGLRR